jgi:5-formyltetrahydrofolate cyclo-ligase
VTDGQNEKSALRTTMRLLLRSTEPGPGVAPALEANLSRAIGSARCIMAFWPLASEPPIQGLIQRLLGERRDVLLPRVDWAERAMTACRVRRVPDDLVSGPKGLLEPSAACPAAAAGDIEVILVPGLAFDAAGNRLGRGGGFYDRFLSDRALRALSIGVCLDQQVVAEVPRDSHDARIAIVVTPTRVLTPSGQRPDT